MEETFLIEVVEMFSFCHGLNKNGKVDHLNHELGKVMMVESERELSLRK